MAGKSKQQKKKSGKSKRRLTQQLNEATNRVENLRKKIGDEEPEELGNGAEPIKPDVDEDAEVAGIEEAEKDLIDQIVKASLPTATPPDEEENIKPEPEQPMTHGVGQDAPFDPMSVVNKFVKKDG